MLKSYVRTAFRNLFNNKIHSLINIAGLSVGLAVAILIGLWAWDELSFNKNHQNYQRIALILDNQTFNGEIQTWWSAPLPLGDELRNSYGSDFKHVVMAAWTGSHLLSYGEKKLTKSGNYMESGAPDMLTLKMLKGSRDGLKDPGSILLSASVAKTFFGDADPLNRIMKIDNKLAVKVTGVYEDLPHNSIFANLTFIAPFELMVKSENLREKAGWGNSWFQTFVQVADHADMDKVSAKIKHTILHKANEAGAKYKPEIFLFPMGRWHLYAQFKNGVSVGGNIQYVWLLGIIGAFVLLLACINFMNLSTARSEKRAKEVGIRKVMGSVRGQLIGQFFSESLLIVVFAFVLSLLLVQLMLPFFNDVANKKISILWGNPLFWLLSLVFILITGFIAGSYPALYLSGFQPVKVLKGTFRVGRLAAIPRKALVVVQFAVSVTLIICTLIVFRQVQFARNRPVGYNRQGLIAIPMKTDEIKKHYPALQHDLLKTGAVAAIAQSESTVTNVRVSNGGLEWKGKDPNMQDDLATLGVTHEFGKVVNWRMKEGRDFSTAFASDSSGFILNEAAVKYMGFKNPIGESVKAFGRNYTVIGVVKDMVMQSPYEPVKQTIFYIDVYDRISFIDIKMNPGISAGAALSKIEAVFKKYDPGSPFEYKFADEEHDAKFRSEERIGKLAGGFTILAVFISCLGLFGMASFMAEQRTKEIGIRKVLGASVFQLWRLLSANFVTLVLIALLIAAPIAWYCMHHWLQNYQYRTVLPWWIFAAAGIGALAITLLTVSFHAIKAAIVNPVKSLRAE